MQGGVLVIIGYFLAIRTTVSHSGEHRSVNVAFDYKLPQFLNTSNHRSMSAYEKRKAIMTRGCSILPTIQTLVEERDFDALFALHKRVYDLDISLNPDDEQCRPPSSVGSKEAKGPLVRSRHTVNVFHEPTTGLTICLPPKAGTTNWQNALASLHNQTGRNHIPRLNRTDYVNAENIQSKSTLMVLNARNPFGRILSAWRDKFSTHASPTRQRPFLAAMDVFGVGVSYFYQKSLTLQNNTTPDGFVRSFEAFAEYLASNPSTFVQNRHWQSIYYHCSPCHFAYDLIVHLESINEDFDEVWKRVEYTPPHIQGIGVYSEQHASWPDV